MNSDKLKEIVELSMKAAKVSPMKFQVDKLLEECIETANALIKQQKTPNIQNSLDAIQETIDVLISALCFIYSVYDREIIGIIDGITDSKINRFRKRIERRKENA